MASRATFAAVRRPLFSTLTTTIVKSPPATAHRRSPLFLLPHSTIFKCAPSAAVLPFFPTRFFSTGDPNVKNGVKNSQDRVLDEIRSEVRSMRRELDYISNKLRNSKKENVGYQLFGLPWGTMSLILMLLIVIGGIAQG